MKTGQVGWEKYNEYCLCLWRIGRLRFIELLILLGVTSENPRSEFISGNEMNYVVFVRRKICVLQEHIYHCEDLRLLLLRFF